MKQILIFFVMVLVSNNFLRPTIAHAESYLEFKASKVKLRSAQVPLLNLVERYSLTPMAESVLLNTVVDFGQNAYKKLSNKDLLKLFKEKLQAIESAEKSEIVIRVPASLEIMVNEYKGGSIDLEKSIQDHFIQRCPNCQIEILRLKSYPDLAEDDEIVEIHQVDLPKGSFAVPFSFKRNGKIELGQITGFSKIMKSVPVAKRTILHGSKLNEDDIEFEWKDVTFKDDEIAKRDEITSSQGRRLLNKGDTILRTDLARLQVVQPGQPLKIRVLEGDLEVAMDAMAQQAGAVGDRIKVKISRTHKISNALVVDSETAELR